MNRITRLTALAVAALAVPAVASPAVAAPKPLVDLHGADVGTYSLDSAGTAHLAGSVTGEPFDGAYVATLAADDGSLPAPGSCEPATGTLDVTSPKRTLRLDAVGEVCGEYAGCHVRRHPPVRRPLRRHRRHAAGSCAEPTAGSR